MSMGHTTVVKAIKGVKNAISMTLPAGYGKHDRRVYVEIDDNSDFKEVENTIKNDSYFINDKTEVIKVDDVEVYKNQSHGVNIVRNGKFGKNENQKIEYNMNIDNPSLTASVLIAAARATTKQKDSGCYTVIEIPVIDFIEGNLEETINNLV